MFGISLRIKRYPIKQEKKGPPQTSKCAFCQHDKIPETSYHEEKFIQLMVFGSQKSRWHSVGTVVRATLWLHHCVAQIARVRTCAGAGRSHLEPGTERAGWGQVCSFITALSRELTGCTSTLTAGLQGSKDPLSSSHLLKAPLSTVVLPWGPQP